MLSSNAFIICFHDSIDGRYVSVNRSFCRLVGYSAAEILGENPVSADFWMEKSDARRFLAHLENNQGAWETVTSFRSKNGKRIPVLISTEVVAADSGNRLLSVVAVMDGAPIQRQPTAGGRSLEKMFADISSCGVLEDSIDDFLVKCLKIMSETMDVSRIYLFQHDHLTDTMSNTHEWSAHGISREKNNLQNISMETLAWMVGELRSEHVINQEDTRNIPCRNMLKVLRRKTVKSILLMPIFVENRYWGFIGFDECRQFRRWKDDDIFNLKTVSRIISVGLSHRQNQEALRAERDFVSMLVQNSPAFFVAINPDGTTMLMNDALLEALDYSAAQVENRDYVSSFVPAPDQENLRKRFERLTEKALPDTGIDGLISRQGKKLTVEWREKSVFDEEGELAFIFRVGIDISEKIHLEEQLRRAQHMEAIGTLSGGIAHDFNNILTPIIIHTELASSKIDDRSDVQSHMSKVLKGARRARNLVRQIMAFSRQDEQAQKPFQLNLIVKEALKLLRATIPSTIEIRHKLSPDIKNIVGDPTQIHQVFMNLCTNAKQAMEKSGGILTVELSEIDLDQEPDSRTLGLQESAYIKLAVSDTGPGINKNEINRIFEPYYSTKGKGEGSGLGLAMVHGIIASHNGAVAVESEPGRGTAFYVYLPVDPSEALSEHPSEGSVKPVGGNERILFVDDEESNIEAVEEMLNNLGYRATVVANSRSALEIFKKAPNAFDLVITDQTMPEMTGVELVGKLLDISPELPVIICTGYSNLISEDNAQKMGVRGFIMKPFEIMDVARKIRKVLRNSNGNN